MLDEFSDITGRRVGTQLIAELPSDCDWSHNQLTVELAREFQEQHDKLKRPLTKEESALLLKRHLGHN